MAGVLLVLSALRLALHWSDPVSRWSALGLVVVLGVFVLAASDYLRHASVQVRAGGLHSIGWLRRRRSVALADVGRVVWASRYLTGGSVRPAAALLVVVSRTGHRLLSLNEGFWAPTDLARLAVALGVTDRFEAVTARDLAERVPGSVAWPVRHPVAMALLVTLGVVVVVVGVAVAVASAQTG